MVDVSAGSSLSTSILLVVYFPLIKRVIFTKTEAFQLNEIKSFQTITNSWTVDNTFSVGQKSNAYGLITVEFRFFEPPREMEIGSKNREFEKSKVASKHTCFTVILFYMIQEGRQQRYITLVNV